MVTQANIQALLELLKIEHPTHIIDIGANPIDGAPPYRALLNTGLVKLTGFEPQSAALQRLDAIKSENETYLPYALGNGDNQHFYECRAPGMSSLLEPDPKQLSLFHKMLQLGEVINKTEITTHRLDDIEEISRVDFIKIDVQGSELEIFKSGKQVLANAVAIHTEVSFLPLYKKQPLFHEVASWLNAQGFIQHQFASLKKWPIMPLGAENNKQPGINQLLEADVVFFRDFSSNDNFTAHQLKQLAWIAHSCYQSVDICLRCIMMLEQRGELTTGSQQAYFKLL